MKNKFLKKAKLSLKKNLFNNRYILILFILAFMLFVNPIISNTLWKSDFTGVFLYYNMVSYESFQNFGEFALWNPLQMSGHPFLGNMQIHVFYPFALLFNFINPLYFIKIIIAFHVFLAGFFMFLFCKKVRINEFGSFIAGTIFMFSTPFIGRIIAGHIAYVYSVAWIPLLFLLMIKLCEDWRFFIPTSWVLSVLFFAGAPQVFHFTLLAIGSFLLFWLFFRCKNKKRMYEKAKPILFFIFSLILTGLIILFLLIPALKVSGESLRSGGTDFKFVSMSSLHFESLISFFIPKFFFGKNNANLGAGPLHESMLYIGILPVFLSLIGLLAFRKKRISIFFFCLAIFSLIFALGKHTPLLFILYKIIPGFNLFRVPSRMLILFTFALAVLSGIGIEYLEELIKEKKKLKRILLVFGALILFVLSGIIFTKMLEHDIIRLFESIFREKLQSNFSHHGIEFYIKGIPVMINNLIMGALSILIIASSTIVGFLLYYFKKIKITHLRIIIGLIIVCDLLLFNVSLFNLKTVDDIYYSSQSKDFLIQDEDHYRVWDLANDYPRWMTWKYNIPTIIGHDPLMLKRYKEFYNLMIHEENLNPAMTWFTAININIDDINNNILNLLNVKYVLLNEQINNPSFVLVNKTKDVYIYQNIQNLPPAFVVGKIKGTQDIKKDLNLFNPKEEVLIQGYEKGKGLGADFKEAEITYYSPNKIIVKTKLAESGILVLSEVFFPGWKAYDNGKQIPIFRVNFALRGVLLPKGEHNIAFVFNPDYFLITLILSLILLLVSCIFFIFLFRQDKKIWKKKKRNNET